MNQIPSTSHHIPEEISGRSDDQANPERVTVWVVDDNESFTFVVGQALNESEIVECTGTFSSCESAIEALRSNDARPDVILLDIGLPGMSGLEGISRIKNLAPAVHIVIITVYDQNENIFKAIYEGASGYLLKSAGSSEMIAAIQAVVAGGMPLDPFVVRKVIKMIAIQGLQKDEYGLTAREKEILSLVVHGLTMSQIAERLFLSYNTMTTHFKNIHTKLQVHTRSEVIVKALKEQLI